MNKRWKSSRTAKFNIAYHLIWCPKYRRKVLINGIDVRLKELLLEKAEDLGITIELIEVMPDHVRLFVKTNPTDNPQQIVLQFKGYASRNLKEEFPKLKSQLPCLWTRSYFCESVGSLSEESIKKYIEDQKNQ
jgi:putative transposase